MGRLRKTGKQFGFKDEQFVGNPFRKRNQTLFDKIVEIIEWSGTNYTRMVQKDPELVEFVDQCTPLLRDSFYTIKTKLVWLLNGFVDFPVCPVCGKRSGYMMKNVRNIFGYRQYCSQKCQANSELVDAARKATCLKNNGVEYPAQKSDILAKQNATKRLKYGNCNNWQKQQETKAERYGDPHWNNHSLCKRTKLEKYGDANYNNVEKTQITCESKSDAEKQEIHRRIQQTMLERYGKKSFLETEQFKRKYYCSLYRQLTARDNMLITSSKSETRIYFALVKKFGASNVIRQYRDSRYPFFCDFYLMTLDLFIEFNGTWAHGKKFFDASNEDDRQKLEYWKSRAGNSAYYASAVKTWTVCDQVKAQTAIKNGLHMLVFWTEKEALNWITNAVVNKNDMSDVKGKE